MLAGTAATIGSLVVPLPHIMRKAAAQDAITIGVVTPLSGPQQLLGNFVKAGAEIGVEYVNANGGVNGRKLRLEFRDEKANPKDALVVTRELLGAGVNFQLGVISSAVALAMGPLLRNEGGIMLPSGAGTDKLNHENYTPNIFRLVDSPYARQTGLARHAITKYPKIDTWGGIIPDHEYGRTTWAMFVDGMLRLYPKMTGRQVKIEQPILVPYGSGDYKNFIAQAMRLPVEGIFTSVYGGDAVTLFQQARPYGFFDKIKAIMDSANDFMVAKAMGTQTPTMWTGTHWYFETNKDNPLSQHLYRRLVEKTGDKYPLGWASEAQAAIFAFVKAIEKTGGSTETADVIAALKGLTFDSAAGLRTIRAEDNQAIKNTELMFIEPSSTAASGFAVTDYISLDGAANIEPPTPGQRLELKTL
jgi:branched-chain amino acid transport system substrate-binding protein